MATGVIPLDTGVIMDLWPAESQLSEGRAAAHLLEAGDLPQNERVKALRLSLFKIALLVRRQDLESQRLG